MSFTPTLPVVNVAVSTTSKFIDLPDATSNAGRIYLIHDFTGDCTNSSTICVKAIGTDTIDILTSTIYLSSPFQSVKVMSDGASNWMILEDYKKGLGRIYLDEFNRRFDNGFASQYFNFTNAIVNLSNLQMNDSFIYPTSNQSHAAFFTQALPLRSFDATFRFAFLSTVQNNAGLCFVIQSNGPSAYGTYPYLGYGYDGYLGNCNSLPGTTALKSSVAIRLAAGTSLPLFSNLDYLPTTTFPSTGNGVAFLGPTGPTIAVGQGAITYGPGQTSNIALYVPLGGTPSNFASWGLLSNLRFSEQGNGITAVSASNLAATFQGFIAVGQDSNPTKQIQYANDCNSLGIYGYEKQWSTIASVGFSVKGNGIAYASTSSNALWVAVGQDADSNANIQYSRDGLAWSNVTSGTFTTAGYGIAAFFSGTSFVGVGQGGNTIKYMTNTSPQTWLNTTGASFATRGNGVGALTGAQGIGASTVWVAVGPAATSTGTILYTTSANGSGPWSNCLTGGFCNQGNAVAWGVNKWVAVGKHFSTNGAGTIQYSFNGVNWRMANQGFSSAGTAVFYSKVRSRWIAMGDGTPNNSRIKWSTDGITWTNAGVASLSFTSNGYGISDAPSGDLVAVGESPASVLTFLRSTDAGSNWSATLASGGFSTVGTGIAYYSNTFYMTGDNKYFYKTIQTITTANYGAMSFAQVGFSTATYAVAVGCNFLAPSSRLYVAVGDNDTALGTIIVSSNLQTWSPNITGGFSTTGYGVVYANDLQRWVATGIGSNAGQTLQWSDNGSNWNTGSGAGFSDRGYGVAYRPNDGLNPSLFIAVGKHTLPNFTILYSSDGKTWTEAQSGGFSSFGKSVAWNGTYWFATGQDDSEISTIRYSKDGSNWKPIGQGGFTVQGNGITWNSQTSNWVVVGENTAKIFTDGPVPGSGSFPSTNILYSAPSADLLPLTSTDFISSGIVPTEIAASGDITNQIDFSLAHTFEMNAKYSNKTLFYKVTDLTTQSGYSTIYSTLTLSNIIGPSGYFGFTTGNGRVTISSFTLFAS